MVIQQSKNPMYIFILLPDGPVCFGSGECARSDFEIALTQTLGEYGCLHFCHLTKGCEWFTYHPRNGLVISYLIQI